jgi:hypothetical protein
LKEAPQTLDPVQQALITVLQAHIHHPACDRNVLLGLLGKLAAPLSSVKIKRCKEIHAEYRKQGLIKPCIEAVSRLFENADAILKVVDSDRIELQRDDMRLICYEWIDG